MGFSRGRDHGQILPVLGAHGRQRGMQSQNFWEKYQDRGGQCQFHFEVLYMLVGAVASGGDGGSGRNLVEVEAGIEVEL